MVSPCGTCDARCCRAYVVAVTVEDALRLSAGSNVPLHRLVACAAQPARTPQGFLLARGGPAYELVLAEQAASPPRPCLFLREQGGRARCAAYPFRPAACRRFPATRREGRSAVRDATVCPPQAWTPAHVERLSYRTALAREARSAEIHAEVVARWNDRVEAGPPQQPVTALAFLDHAAETYAWLVRWRAALRPSERASPEFVVRLRDALRELPQT